MVKSIVIGKKKRLMIIAGVSKRFAIGIAIEQWSAFFDFGPFWISFEW